MPCVCNLDKIEQFCGGVNAAGLTRKLDIACADDIDVAGITPPTAGTHVVSVDIPHPATKGFHAWNFAKEDQEWTSERDAESGLWTTTTKIFIKKLEAEKSFILNATTGDNYIALVADRNGNRRIVGAVDNGCEISVKEQATPKNGYEVTITWESAHSPYFYTGAVVNV